MMSTPNERAEKRAELQEVLNEIGPAKIKGDKAELVGLYAKLDALIDEDIFESEQYERIRNNG